MIDIENFDRKDLYSGPYKRWLTAVAVVFIVSGLIWFGYFITQPPGDFPSEQPFVVEEGTSAREVANQLQAAGLVRSSGLFYMILLYAYDPGKIQAGTYLFTEPTSVFEVAKHIATTAPLLNLVSITLPEGFTVSEFATIVSKAGLKEFNVDEFQQLSADKEGYLFPDTYYVSANFTAEELLNLLQQTYLEKTKDIRSELEASPLGEYGVLILASLLEREAKDQKSMEIVSGILQNRLANSMRLQVDSSLEYVLHKSLDQLTADDLKLDSPYNTYLYDGLPPTPIGNPGLMAIKAVLYPAESDYFYYLTDEEGNFHYAKTFEEHKANIARYLQ